MGKLLSAFASFLVSSVLVKSFALFALYFVLQALMPFLVSLLPTETNLDELFSLLPNSAWYFINLFQLTTGLSMLISALVVRFIIRRLPIIG